MTGQTNTAASSLLDAMSFIWREAELLDRREYPAWLTLWRTEGIYVIPIDPDTEDFDNSLNYVLDNDEMRRARVARLMSAHSMSATAAARTARTVSRFVVVADTAHAMTVRCVQHLVETKRDVQRTYAAEITYDLARGVEGLLIERKVVRLINSTDALGGVAYLF
ncbi:aromatic-ring-hydroxylating dioxygenase subunit beta [Caulobacter sp. 602-1]|uniref:aromatic-ring-hydroxylating dioxygenase subunit beta n=1 Tax=Caulobacter sp. 602-1 TaxID=2492472 RepID=UPI000F63D629|nr:aromatic-ring-hydroxylating dioxygenase subunit beta [Caulobacter sp. 602-1]RRN63810.1 hypothetical protein EIK80_13630 [Caulobacter sp. 602-1]